VFGLPVLSSTHNNLTVTPKAEAEATKPAREIAENFMVKQYF